MARYEEGHQSICFAVPYLSAGEDREAETSRTSSASSYSGVEMGEYRDGFRYWFSEVDEEE